MNQFQANFNVTLSNTAPTVYHGGWGGGVVVEHRAPHREVLG